MFRFLLSAATGLLMAGCVGADGPFEVEYYEMEWGGMTRHGVPFSVAVPGVQVRAVLTAPLRNTEVDLARALDAAEGWCGRGKRWVPVEGKNPPSYYEGVWYLPGSCEVE